MCVPRFFINLILGRLSIKNILRFSAPGHRTEDHLPAGWYRWLVRDRRMCPSLWVFRHPSWLAYELAALVTETWPLTANLRNVP
jgi:hypothetical protein